MIGALVRQGCAEMGLAVEQAHIDAFEIVARELKKWNSRINLTALVSDRDIAIKHIVDSLVFAGMVRDGERVLDIGSGAGMPAIPLKIVRPDIGVVSVDAVAKKVQFQRHLARSLGLVGFQAIHGRIESLDPSHRHAYSLVTSRAFSNLGQFVRLAVPFMEPAGWIVAMKGPGAGAELESSQAILQECGLKVVSVREYRLPQGLGERSLVCLERERP